MKRTKVNVSYLLSIISVVLYIFVPSFIKFTKTVEFVFAAAAPVIAAAGLVLYIIACKKLNFHKEQLPFFAPSVITMTVITAVNLAKLITGISLGFVPVLGDGIFKYFEYILVAFSVYNAFAAVCISLMKTEK